MERLTKKELRALLECIKDCYPICDLETFGQRVISRLSKIVPKEIIPYNVVNPRRQRNAYPPHFHDGYTPSKNKIFDQRLGKNPVIIQHPKIGDTKALKIAGLMMRNQFHALSRESKDFGDHDKLLLKLLSPHVMQAYRNAERVTQMQQKLTLVEEVLDRLHLGIIVLTPDRKVRLATESAVKQVTNYLGYRRLRGNRLPESLWRWVKQQEVTPSGKDDGLLRRSPLVLEREGKRLVIRLVSYLNQSSLLLEEHPTTMQLQSLVPFGLSPREAQVLDWVAQGKTNKEIGVILELSPRTVQKHLEHIYRKIYVESRTAAAAKAYELASIASKQTASFALSLVTSLIA
jgi:DNA-binding CsgD family transcriptional regulator